VAKSLASPAAAVKGRLLGLLGIRELAAAQRIVK
jgi:hypothetical protein